MEAGRWEHFSHEADVGIRGTGPTRESAFSQAARAMIAAITDVDAVKPAEPVTISAEAPDDELLLVEWLNAIVFEIATREMLFSRFDVAIDGNRLSATAWGEPLDKSRHRPAVEVKGATYTSLVVRHEEGGAWTAQCVVDV